MRQRKKSLNVQDPGPDPAQDPVQDPVLMIVDVGPDVQVDLKETKKNSNICIRSWHISTDSYTYHDVDASSKKKMVSVETQTIRVSFDPCSSKMEEIMYFEQKKDD